MVSGSRGVIAVRAGQAESFSLLELSVAKFVAESTFHQVSIAPRLL
jgi:hypothetical protein